MVWSPVREKTCLVPFLALPCITTVTARLEGILCAQRQHPLLPIFFSSHELPVRIGSRQMGIDYCSNDDLCF